MMNKSISMALVALMLAIVFGFILAYPMMLLWNLCLVPAISVLNEVDWFQMWGINILCGVWFKSTTYSKS
jgi:hypothetical protein